MSSKMLDILDIARHGGREPEPVGSTDEWLTLGSLSDPAPAHGQVCNG